MPHYALASDVATPGLRVFTGNRLERLAEKTAELLRRPLSSPLCSETIIVPNRGMERWLSMQLSLRCGVWANCRFLFPTVFVQTLFATAFPEISRSSPWDPRLLCWRVLAALKPPLLNDPAFASLKHYCSDGRILKRYQLASKIADTFDQYAVHRPDLLLDWDDGKGNEWQPRLWRTLVASCPIAHPARLWKRLIDLPPEHLRNVLPERITVFGHSSLPPYHLAVLEAASRVVPVYILAPNPCAEYWDDIVSDREEARTIGRSDIHPEKDGASHKLHLERGNTLLAALGAYGRDFLSLLHERSFDEEFLETDPGNTTLLATIQHDILRLIDRGATPAYPPIELRPDDRSIEVHSCHSPLREIEALYEYLLDVFASCPDITPSDVLVMAPDIHAYAPFIAAVFGAPEEERMRIPYSIADLTAAADGTIARALLSLLSLCSGRAGAGEVLSLLDVPEIRSRFGIEEDDLPALHAWTRECGVSWGLDASAWSDRGLPAHDDNTWQKGLERLLAGYALASDGSRMFRDLLPYDGIEGSQALCAGALAEFIGRIAALDKRTRCSLTPTEWSHLLLDALDTFFLVAPEKNDEAMRLRELIAGLAVDPDTGISEEPLDRETASALLAERLSKLLSPSPFPGNGVTFSTLMPMRGIPFAVVCCVGMNATDFPRTSWQPSWNLMTMHPRKGDRSVEREDRYLFLEAILSARLRLYISFSGQSVREQRDDAPSTVVEELLSVIDRGFLPPSSTIGAFASRTKARESIMVRHRLQPWSSAYFSGNPRLMSHSRANFAAASALADTARPIAAIDFFEKPLPDRNEEHGDHTIDDLAAFLRHPVRFFCEKRLGIRLDTYNDATDDNECFLLSGQRRYRIAQDLISHFLAGGSAGDAYDRLSAAGALPLGATGKSQFDALSADVRLFTMRLYPYISTSAPLPPATIDLTLADTRLTGTIDALFPAGHIRYRFSKNMISDLLALWVEHCALNTRAPCTSYLFGENIRWRLDVPADPRRILTDLIAMFHEGYRRPLPFFQKTSHAYADAIINNQMPAREAFEKALDVWDGSEYVQGEKHDLWLRFFLRGVLTHTDDFSRSAVVLWQPVFACLHDLEDGP